MFSALFLFRTKNASIAHFAFNFCSIWHLRTRTGWRHWTLSRDTMYWWAAIVVVSCDCGISNLVNQSVKENYLISLCKLHPCQNNILNWETLRFLVNPIEVYFALFRIFSVQNLAYPLDFDCRLSTPPHHARIKRDQLRRLCWVQLSGSVVFSTNLSFAFEQIYLSIYKQVKFQVMGNQSTPSNAMIRLYSLHQGKYFFFYL